jgi:hypothetical protein
MNAKCDEASKAQHDASDLKARHAKVQPATGLDPIVGVKRREEVPRPNHDNQPCRRCSPMVHVSPKPRIH